MLLVLIIGWISAEPLNSPITGIKQYQQSGSFLLFISGFISMIGIGWVRKKKI
jgi:uncharacterized membrane protein